MWLGLGLELGLRLVLRVMGLDSGLRYQNTNVFSITTAVYSSIVTSNISAE